MKTITVEKTSVGVLHIGEQDYISLTDMAAAKEGESRAADIIKNWIRARYAIEFLGTWEIIHNPEFKVVEFNHFRQRAGLPSFVLSASEWIERTDAIGLVVRKGRYGGTNIIPPEVTAIQANIIYANEADVLNVALFGLTAKQWREANPDLKGNIRDYATINELICLSNMESLNAVFIEQGLPQRERLVKLNQIAIHQISVLENHQANRKWLK